MAMYERNYIMKYLTGLLTLEYIRKTALYYLRVENDGC